MSFINTILSRRPVLLGPVMVGLLFFVLLLLGVFLFAVPVTVKKPCVFWLGGDGAVYIKTRSFKELAPGQSALLVEKRPGASAPWPVTITRKTAMPGECVLTARVPIGPGGLLPAANINYDGFCMAETRLYALLR